MEGSSHSQIPRYELSTVSGKSSDLCNAAMDATDAELRKNYKLYGIDAICDLRGNGSPFDLPDYTNASFETAAASGYYALSDAANKHIHLQDLGFTFVANRLSQVLKTLRP